MMKVLVLSMYVVRFFCWLGGLPRLSYVYSQAKSSVASGESFWSFVSRAVCIFLSNPLETSHTCGRIYANDVPKKSDVAPLVRYILKKNESSDSIMYVGFL